jgi:hypothetical protein
MVWQSFSYARMDWNIMRGKSRSICFGGIEYSALFVVPKSRCFHTLFEDTTLRISSTVSKPRLILRIQVHRLWHTMGSDRSRPTRNYLGFSFAFRSSFPFWHMSVLEYMLLE